VVVRYSLNTRHRQKFDFYVKVNKLILQSIETRDGVNKYYTITELTREFGVSTRTLRFYEDEGLIHPERRGRTRLFRSADRRLIMEILRGRRIGFTIAEIREIIQVYKDPPGESGQLRLLMKRVEEKRDDLRQKRKDIDDTLEELNNVEEACLTRLAEIGVST
jgi:DNA-binding transcriptional MerR regulator